MIRYSHINKYVFCLGRIPISGTSCPICRLPAGRQGLKTFTELQQTNYELAFHLSPNLEEAKVKETKEKIENIITSNKGVISYSKEPEKIRLSYDIKHHRNSFFSYIQFNLSELKALDELNEHIKLNPDILRYLIIKLPSDLQKKQSMLKQVKMKERQEKRIQTKTATQKETKKESGGLDKKLEEIIEQL